MPDTIDGTIQEMRELDPTAVDIDDGQIWRSRETSAPKRESTFVWDPAAYVGPLYNSGQLGAPNEVPQYVGFAPDFAGMENGSQGVWRWMTPPAGSIDAERVYGVSPKETAFQNALRLQRCVDEVLASDATWPRDTNEPGDGDSWKVLLPAGTIELDEPITFNRKTPPVDPACGTTEKITVAGRIILQGQGRTTRLVYTGDDFDVNFFQIGGPPSERHDPGCVFIHVGFFVLRDLEIRAATNGGFATLRFWQSRGDNILENVKVAQLGNGDGINASEIIFSEFNQVVVQRSPDSDAFGETTPLAYSGRGFWIHTDDAPYIISGQTIINRMSVFGSFEKGIVVGENAHEERLVGSISGQFINAEGCQEGIVFRVLP